MNKKDHNLYHLNDTTMEEILHQINGPVAIFAVFLLALMGVGFLLLQMLVKDDNRFEY